MRAALILLLALPLSHGDKLCGVDCSLGAGSYAPPGCSTCECCAPCPAGAYCRNADADGTYTLCPPGAANPTTGGKGANACKDCRVGQAQPSAGATACPDCPPNTFAATAGLSNCTACGAGNASSAGAGACCLAGSWSAPGSGACSVCSPGSYCPPGAAQALPCAPGSYSAGLGATACAACQPGKAVSIPGATGCSPCAQDHTSGAGAGACTLCPAGTYSPEGSTKCKVNTGFAIGCSVLGFAGVLAIGRLLAPRLFCVEAAQTPDSKPFLAA